MSRHGHAMEFCTLAEQPFLQISRMNAIGGDKPGTPGNGEFDQNFFNQKFKVADFCMIKNMSPRGFGTIPGMTHIP